MDVLQLRYFLTIVETGSLSKASEVLRISQPSLSQRMNHLEREFGVQLLERGPRGTRLTPTGTAFARDATRLVRQFDHLAATARQPLALRGLVAVGLPSGAAKYLAAPLYARMRRDWPGVRLELFESMSGYINELFDRGRMDLTLAYTLSGDYLVGDVPVYSEDLYVVGDPGGVLPTGEKTIPVQELTGVPIVAPASHSSLRALIERVLRQHQVEPEVVADVESLGTMVRLAQEGQACALLPLSAAAGTDVPVRRLEPAVARDAVVRTAPNPSAPGEAIDAVRSSIIDLTHQLAATGHWPGITPKESAS